MIFTVAKETKGQEGCGATPLILHSREYEKVTATLEDSWQVLTKLKVVSPYDLAFIHLSIYCTEFTSTQKSAHECLYQLYS